MKKLKNQTEVPNLQVPRVEILGTERRTVTSYIANESYDLYVNFPPSYWNPEKKTTYPVLYVLNGQWDFSMMLGSFGNQYFDGLIPEIIIVGITWSGGENLNLDFHNLQLRDFTPVRGGDVNSRGADVFLSILMQELIPFVEAEYPVTNDRALAGGSISGLFALYVMFKTELFKRFIISSPTVEWSNGFIFDYEVEYNKDKKRLPTQVCLTYGEYENSTFIRHFITQVKSRNYENFNLETIEVKGTGHAGNKPECFTRGLLFIYKRPEFNLSQQELAMYEGKYLLDNKSIEIRKNNKGLMVRWSDQSTSIELFAERENFFYAKGTFLFFTFLTDNYIINQVKIEVHDKETIARKIIHSLP